MRQFEVSGCTDSSACSYDADATDDNESCAYADAGYDCEGNCLADADGDGVCDNSKSPVAKMKAPAITTHRLPTVMTLARMPQPATIVMAIA